MTRARVHTGLLHSTALVAFSAGTLCVALCLAPRLAAAQANQQPNQMTEGGLAKVSAGSPSAATPTISAAQVAVDDSMQMNASKDSDNWLLYGRTYDNQRFSPLKQINAQTVKTLAPVAIIQTGVANTFEDSPSR